MKESITISRSRKLPKALDYRALRQAALEFAQQYSGSIWTDYNEHDPGVTIIEYLCYTITDLAYRADFDIIDILYAKTEDKDLPADSLYPPKDILPSHPQTFDDYRKLIIDRIEEVNNAWLTSGSDPHYEGLYEIALQLSEDYGPSTHLGVIEKVRQTMMEHRNLCEDLASITVLQSLPLMIKATISLDIDAQGEAVIARVLAELEAYLIPRVRTHTLVDLQQEGQGINSIFDGPAPAYGFIKDNALRPLNSVIYVSKLIEVVSKVAGVRYVENLMVSIKGLPVETDEIALPENTYPILAPEMKEGVRGQSLIKLNRSGVSVPVDLQQVQQQHRILVIRRQKKYQTKLDLDQAQPASTKKLADLLRYNSMQRLFPAVYGIGSYGLSIEATEERKAQAKQLKAFLTIFEQFMANYLAQLAHLKDLFSVSEDLIDAPSYYGQLPLDIPDFLGVLKNPTALLGGQNTTTSEQATNAQTGSVFRELIAAFDNAVERRNRFLNHQLARFGEVFYADLLRHTWTGEGLSEEEMGRELLAAKAGFLRAYPQLSRDRGKGFNYTESSWVSDEDQAASENVSGLEKKLYQYLNFQYFGNRNLTAYSMEGFSKLSSFRVQEGAKKTKSKRRKNARLSIRELLRYGMRRERYNIVKLKNGLFGAYFRRTSNAEPQLVFLHEEKIECQRVIRELMKWLRKLNTDSNGFFLVEHILLRPSTQHGRQLSFDVSPTGVIKKFQSLQFHPAKEIRHFSDVLMITASNPNNYSELKQEDETYLLLKFNERPFLISTEPFTPEELAAHPVDKIVAHLNGLKKSGSTQIDEWIELTSEENYAKKIGSSFFSHRLSLVLPDWPRRLQMNDFRRYLTFLLQMSVPAHLQIDLHWLDFGKMQAFEKVYQEWLQEKSREEVSPWQLDSLSMRLIQMLLKKSENQQQMGDFLTREETIRQRQRKQQLAVLGAVGYAILDEHNLRIFVGIDATAELLLRHHDIDSWAKLRVAPPERLAEILREASLSERIESISAWQRQATLAERRKWPELIALQQQLEKLKKKTAKPKIIRYMEQFYGASPKL